MYHINGNGDPGVCTAKSDNCPFGSVEDHFTSASQARYSYESRMGSMEQPKLKKASSPRLADMKVTVSDTVHDDTFNGGDHEIDYTPEQVLEKFQKDINGHTYALTSRNNPGEPGLILERLFGKEPDSDPTADLGTVELKTFKKTSRHPISLGSLHMEGDIRSLRRQYLGGRFNESLQAGEWMKVGDNYYTLLVDRKTERVRLIIANSHKEFVSTNDFGWNFSRLHKKVDDKLANIAVATYETHELPDGNRTVTFDGLALGGFTRDSLIDKIESGDVRINFNFMGDNHRTTLASELNSFAEKKSLQLNQ